MPILRTLEQIGAPVERLSKQARMPLDVVRECRGVIGEFSLWKFIEISAKREGYHNLGYDCAQSGLITTVAELGGFRMRLAPTLKVILEYFIEDIRSESTSTFYSLRYGTDAAWFHRVPPFGKHNASWQAEQYIIAVIIQIIRICADPGWLPTHIHVNSVDKPQKLPDEWSDINVAWGCEATEIRIPNMVMASPPTAVRRTFSNSADKETGIQGSTLQFVDLVESQIRTGRFGFENTAEELGLSKTTLKRKLGSMETSYSEIVEQVRFDLARQMLLNTEVPISEIAIDLGYRHPANFSRAFKRISGLSPITYRLGMFTSDHTESV